MIFFILPIFNEEKNLPSLISDIRKSMKDQEYKILAINDGSTDNSLEILYKLQSYDIIIINSLVNMNVGATFSAGIDTVLAESKDNDDIVVVMEGDQTSTINYALNLISELRKREDDIVIASRYKRNGGVVHFPLIRRIYSRCASALMHYYFPINSNISDYTIFFRSYRVGIFKKAIRYFGKFGLIQSKGFGANTELLIKLSMLTNRISEIPFVYDYSRKEGKSKIKVLRTIGEYFIILSYLRSGVKKVNAVLSKKN
tara:strand:+ start:7969 stop:8739 length:771 start_codon:yes stop_codon:yes gene_type:complete